MSKSTLFPMRVSANKSILFRNNPAAKVNLIASCLLTAVGERADDPEKGTIGDTYLFRLIHDGNEALIKYLIRTRLGKSFPTIRVEKIDLKQDIYREKVRLIGEISYLDLEYSTQGVVSVELAKE